MSPKHVVNQVINYENHQARSEIYLSKVDKKMESNKDFHKIQLKEDLPKKREDSISYLQKL